MMFLFFFVKQKTAYEMLISDWSSDVCSSDLAISSPGTLATMNRFAITQRLRNLGPGLRFLQRALSSRYCPLLAQMVVTRRCNLSCGYCNEYDDFSPPVPLPTLLAQITHLAQLKTASITLTGGEPLLHPQLEDLIRAVRGRGMIVTMITNGFRLSRERIERLNAAGLQGMQISIDNLQPDEISMKSLVRSEEHTSELQSLMPISYAVFCLKKKTKQNL